MMKFKYSFLFCGLLLIVACSEDVERPDVRISTSATTYKVGEPVVFKIDGYADMISFYSGEPTNDYAYKDGRVINIAGEDVSLQFTSAVTGGSQAGQLTFFASTDFNGDYQSLETVKGATWIDITSRFKFGTSATFLSSTVQDITDLVVSRKPIYFAYRYMTKPQAANGLARTWMIQTFELKSSAQFNDAELVITDQANAGFRIVEQEPENAPARSTITASRLSLLGNVYKDPADPIFDPENPIYDPNNPIYDPTSHLYNQNAVRPKFVPYDPESPYNDPETEQWAVTKPLYLEQVDLGPDWSRPIKNIANSDLEEYKYIYEKPGTYTAYFVAINSTIDGKKEVITEFTLTITP